MKTFKQTLTESTKIKPKFKVGDCIKRIDGKDKNTYCIAAIEGENYIFQNLRDKLWIFMQDDYKKVKGK
jgi:hypothetical protein